MSAFIGPIHYWLYGKIRLVIQREEMIFDKASQMCGSTAEELRDQVWQSYGAPPADTDLADLIDHGNIHGWLQRQINLAESREAALIKELTDTCGGAAEQLVEEAFAEHGKLAGKQAAAQGRYDVGSAAGIYKALTDSFLNGMPCDQADTVMESDAEKVVWETGACLQEPNWKRTGVDGAFMKKLYQVWLGAFVQGVSPSYSLKVSGNRHEISKG